MKRLNEIRAHPRERSIDVLPEPCQSFCSDSIDLVAQPFSYQVLHAIFAAFGFQLFNGVSRFIQRDVVTGHHLRPVFRRNEIEQVALAARMSAVRIAVIETTERILEDGFWQPRRANRSAISSLLDEIEFPLEN